MKTLREVFLKLIAFAVGVTLTIAVTYVFTDADGKLQLFQMLIGGCFGILLVEFTRMQMKVDEQHKRLDTLSGILAEKAFTEAQRAALLGSPERHLQNLNEVSQAWIDLLWSVEKSYTATNHIPNKDIYEQGYAKCALGIQSVKREVKQVPITKVFILENDAEYTEMLGTMQAQKRLGFNVKYIRLDTIKRAPTLKQGELESIDFGIFDQEIVLVWHLDSARTPVSGRIVTGKEKIKPYQDYLDRLLREVSEIPSEGHPTHAG